MKRRSGWFIFLSALIFLNWGRLSGREFSLFSPDKSIRLDIQAEVTIDFSVYHKDLPLLGPSRIMMVVDGRELGIRPKIRSSKTRTVDQILNPVIRQKSEQIRDHFNELEIRFSRYYDLVFRAYNDGIAYRWRTRYRRRIKVEDEIVEFNFQQDHRIYFPEEESFFTHQERLYRVLPLSQISAEMKSSTPALVEFDPGPKVLITEADLYDYPGMYLSGCSCSPTTLKGVFPGYALEEILKRDRDYQVTKSADFLADTPGNREFPWRVMVIASEDGDLIRSQIVYKLATPLKLEDTTWIKPGKVAWDWWNANNIRNVDFRAGVNTETYKYYIDFAARYGLEYIILDEGWYKLGDLMTLNPDIDMEAILNHAETKGIGVILWVVWKTLEDQLEEALNQFQKWGVRGIKVDFMQRDDQWMVNYYHKIAAEAAKRQLLVDFHGSYKPTGLRRAYPNVITREGVVGLENSKWGEKASPENALIIPFIRMVAGPMDYTPGAMLNATKKNFKAVFDKPMSQGTRCHQLAMYVVFESPLQMLCDSPSHYFGEEECMAFLSGVPTVWDETRVLEAKIADYVLLARRHGRDWYVAAMTDWTAREKSVDFSFLPPGEYRMDIYRDGINADRNAQDYKKVTTTVSSGDRLKIKLAPGGGWVARIYR